MADEQASAERPDLMSYSEVLAALEIQAGAYSDHQLRKIFEAPDWFKPPCACLRIGGEWHIRRADLPRIRAALRCVLNRTWRNERFSRK